MKVIAIHGDYATGEILRRDMGDPAWVDEYVTWWSRVDVVEEINNHKQVILIGYSRGAEIARQLAGWDRVRAIVGYEPLAENIFEIGNDKPKLLITNTWGRGCWTQAGYQSNLRWLAAGAEHLQGRGFHVRPRFGWPPIGHAWDQSLNDGISAWINRVKGSNENNT